MASISFRFPENTKPIGITIELAMEEAWEIIREQHRIHYSTDDGKRHQGNAGMTRSLMERLHETLRAYPDPNEP